MTVRISRSLLALSFATVAVGLLGPTAAQAQARNGGQWVVPRTPAGHPDLQGNWSNATLTPLSRPRDQESHRHRRMPGVVHDTLGRGPFLGR